MLFRTLTPFLSVLAALVIFFFYTKPLYTEIQGIRAETEEYRDAKQNAAKFNQKLSELVQKKNEFGARDLERLEALMPSSIDEVKLLVDLEALVRSHGMLMGEIEITTADIEEEGEAPSSGDVSLVRDFEASDLTFSLTGTYEQFRSLLRDIESSLTLMEVVGISFSSSNSVLQQYSITLRTYALPPSNLQ